MLIHRLELDIHTQTQAQITNYGMMPQPVIKDFNSLLINNGLVFN